MDDVVLMIAGAFDVTFWLKLLVVSTSASFGFSVIVLVTMPFRQQSST